jgi:hypothetical protein
MTTKHHDSIVHLGVVAVMTAGLAACSHTTEIVREPVIQQQPVVDRVTVVQPAPAVVQPPPAPLEVAPPMPAGPGYTWVPGRYVLSGGDWVWVRGHWAP